jgi:hypothetical protein
LTFCSSKITPPTLPSSAMCSMSVPCPVDSRPESTERREGFFAQATTAAYLSLPRLIIADCMIPAWKPKTSWPLCARCRRITVCRSFSLAPYRRPKGNGATSSVARRHFSEARRVAGLCRDGGYDGAPLEWDGRRVGRPASKLAMTL